MNIAIVGYGKMGKKIEQLAGLAGHQILMKIDENNADEYFSSTLKNFDVIIEFSTPDTAFDNIMHGIRQGVPVVSGTTGWLDRFVEIEKVVNDYNGSFFYASNYSIGMNLFFKINSYAAQLMNKWSAYNVHIDETHHTEKLDQPSGTSISLAEQIIRNTDDFQAWVNEKKSANEQLEIFSHRIENNPGTHQIFYQSEVDYIELKHEAKSRDGFAKGAIMAAEWLHTKKGIFSMEDLINELSEEL